MKKYSTRLSIDKIKEIKENLKCIKNMTKQNYRDTLLNSYLKEINLVTYNNKDIVQNTWNSLDTDKIRELNKEEKYIPLINKNSKLENNDYLTYFIKDEEFEEDKAIPVYKPRPPLPPADYGNSTSSSTE